MAEDVHGDQEVLVGRSYTRARRYPLVIGRIPGSQNPLIGGPYSLPQLFAMVGTFVLLVFTREVWAQFSLIGNLLVVVGVPFAAGLVVRRLQVQGRPPWSVAASLAGLLISPASGRMGGRPLPRRRARHIGGVFTFRLQPAGGAPSRRPSVAAAAPAPGRVLSPAQALLAARRGDRADGRP